MKNEIYVLEFCPSAKAFHIDTLQRTIQLNRENFRNGVYLDWIIISMGEHVEMSKLASNLSSQYDANKNTM